VRDLDTLIQVRELGVTRCGASRTREMLDEWLRRHGKALPQVSAATAPGGY
jgi:deoxyribose-phosphate aldolase